MLVIMLIIVLFKLITVFHVNMCDWIVKITLINAVANCKELKKSVQFISIFLSLLNWVKNFPQDQSRYD